MAKSKRKVVKEEPENRVLDKETGEWIVTPPRLVLADEMIDDKNEYPPFFKTPYNHDTLSDATASGTLNNDKSLTIASQAHDTNINVIMERYGITKPGDLAKPPPSFLYFPEGTWDMHQVIKIHQEAEDAFMQLPAAVRAQFDNDLARYVGYVDDRLAANDYQSLRALGLDVTGAPEPSQEARQETQVPATKTEPAEKPVSVSTVTNK